MVNCNVPSRPFLGNTHEPSPSLHGPRPDQVGSLHEELGALVLFYSDPTRHLDREVI